MPFGAPWMLTSTGNCGWPGQSPGFTKKLPTQSVVTWNCDCESSSRTTVTSPTPMGGAVLAGP